MRTNTHTHRISCLDEEMEACDPSIYDPTLFTPANSQPASPMQRSFGLSVDRDKVSHAFCLDHTRCSVLCLSVRCSNRPWPQLHPSDASVRVHVASLDGCVCRSPEQSPIQSISLIHVLHGDHRSFLIWSSPYPPIQRSFSAHACFCASYPCCCARYNSDTDRAFS